MRVEELRVGFFTECYRPIVNGIVASVDGLAQGLRSRGHDVYLFTPKIPGYEHDAGGVVRLHSLPLPVNSPYRLTLPLVSRRNLNSVIKRLSVIHAHSPFVTGWMGVHYSRRFNIPLVYTYHTQLEQYVHYVPFDAATTRRAASAVTRLYANAADAVIVPTQAMREHLQSVGVTARIEVVPSGIDLHAFGSGRRTPELRQTLGAAPGERLALCVSRIAREKNLELVLQALAAAPDPALKLALVGEGPAREWLELRAEELGVAHRVCFAGAFERERLPDVYACADSFVFPSVSETQGLVLAEALAAGCPVIAVDTPQARDVLGECATIVPEDARQLAQALEKMPSSPDATVRERLRNAALPFGVDIQTDRVIDLYADLTRRDPALVH